LPELIGIEFYASPGVLGRENLMRSGLIITRLKIRFEATGYRRRGIAVENPARGSGVKELQGHSRQSLGAMTSNTKNRLFDAHQSVMPAYVVD
jgi:hypothetical protein